MVATLTSMLDILLVGKSLIQEVSRHSFATDIGIADTLDLVAVANLKFPILPKTRTIDRVQTLPIIRFYKIASFLCNTF